MFKKKKKILYLFVGEGLFARIGPRVNTDAFGSIIGYRDAKGLVEMCGDELC